MIAYLLTFLAFKSTSFFVSRYFNTSTLLYLDALESNNLAMSHVGVLYQLNTFTYAKGFQSILQTYN